MNIKVNMCGVDRALRVLASVLFIYIGFVNTAIIGNSIVNLMIGSFGALNLISALVGFCPVYFMAQISSLREQK